MLLQRCLHGIDQRRELRSLQRRATLKKWCAAKGVFDCAQGTCRMTRQRLVFFLLSGTITTIMLLGSTLLEHSNTSFDSSCSSGYTALDYVHDNDPEDACNCSRILQGEPDVLANAKLLTLSKSFQEKILIPDEDWVNATHSCSEFRLTRKYLSFPLSQEEEDFPLAFSLVVHHKVQTFERLLRAIYAPQNIYCVHVDEKAPASVFTAIAAITSCFPNVFITNQTLSVVYAGWSRVQADLNCMADLYNNSATWKYFINLCGQDFPLKTNLEMVRSLRALGGRNSMESEKMPIGKARRWQIEHHVVNGMIRSTGKAKSPPPHHLPILSGNAYILVSRGYVRSVLEDSRVQDLIQWSKDTYSPDEFLWATIQRIPGVPGSTWPSSKYDTTDMNALARLVKWQWHEGSEGSPGAVYPKCHGMHVRGICVYGAGDLGWLIQQQHLFANKFDMVMDPVVIRCLEKFLRHRAVTEALQLC